VETEDTTFDAPVSMEQKVAARAVADGKVGLDPVTIMKIVQVILPVLIKCFSGDDQPDPGQVRASVADQNARQPRRLRRRMTARIMREDRSLSRDQAEALAQATIDETLDNADDAVAGYVKLHI
jgi:hypothetical protein